MLLEGKAGKTLYRKLTKRWKTTDQGDATAAATASVSASYFLPPELLEIIFGFLDVRTLCTARLVCSQFHGAASRCIHSVELSVENLRSRPETTFGNFPNLSRVSITDVKEKDLRMLVRSPVAAAVTHLQAALYLRQLPQVFACSPLLPLRNLVSLAVSHAACRAFPLLQTVGELAFSFPQTLRELTLEGRVTGETANLVTRLTNLTCLRINVCGNREPFEAVTALTALQRLEISCTSSLIPFVVELTLLTHLHYKEMGVFAMRSDSALASLTRLHRLVHFGLVGAAWDLEHQLQASMGTLTSLRSLDLWLGGRPNRTAFDTCCMTPFSQLTALKLGSDGLDASFLPEFNLERLQGLSLSYGVKLHQDGVAALKRATGLTHLELWDPGMNVGPEEVGAALACMSRLRALSLGSSVTSQATSCSKAIGLLTELTRLEWCGAGVIAKADAEVCLGLKKLRLLRMSVPWMSLSDPITPETVFAIAKLPELHKFDIMGGFLIWGRHFRLTDDVRLWLNAERRDKGWPPVRFHIFP